MTDGESVMVTDQSNGETTPNETKLPAEVIAEIENLVEGRVIVYVSYRSVGPWDITPFYESLAEIGHQENLSILIASSGGYPDDAFKLANLIHEFGEHVTFIVPTNANSAATLLCLSGNRILMGPTSELGPTNPMMSVDQRLITPTVLEPGGGSDGDRRDWDALPKRTMAAHALRDFLIAANVLTSEGGYDPEKLSVYMTQGILNPFLLGDFERSGKIALQYAESLLKNFMFKDDPDVAEKAEKTARLLCEGYFDHSYPIARKEAREHLKLKVEDMSDDLWQAASSLVHAYGVMMREQRIARVLETSQSNSIDHWADK